MIVKKVSALLVAALFLAVVIVAPSSTVLARENEDHGRDNNRSEQKQNDHAKNREDKNKESKNTSEDKQKSKEQQAKENKQNKCQSRKQGLETKLSSLITNAQRHKQHIDDVFTKVQEYKTTNNLTVENYDSLVMKAKAAQDQAQNSVTTLGAMTPSVDCNKDSVASDVATFKAVASQTRDDLKSYRTTVKDLLKAVENAKGGSSNGSQTQAQ